MSNSIIPKQKLSFKEKKKKDFQWGKDTIKAYIERSDFNSARKQKLYNLYDIYNGISSPDTYDYVSDPYKSEARGTKRKFPAKIRSYNIIKPVIDLLVGERSNRPFNPQVVVKNSDVKSKFEEYRTEQYLNYLEQAFVNKLNEQTDTGIPSKELPSPEEFDAKIKTSYRDKRAIIGQEAIEYIIDKIELQDKLQTAFFDWLVTGEVYTYKGTLFDDIDYGIVSPTEILYEKSPSTKFIEDGDMAGQRKLLSVNQVLDMFHDVLDEDEVDRIERPQKGSREGFNIPFVLKNGSDTGPSPDEDRLVEVYHINWKSFAKVGYVDRLGEFGVMETVEVSEDYIPDEGEKVDWEWVTESWEGYQIDGDIYKHIRAVDPQRNLLSNNSSCKLSYNGLHYSNRNSENVSIVGMGIPYQVLYNVFHFRLELSIAKNKDKIALMELNTIPKKHGWDEEKFMYFADALGFAFIDSTAVGQNKERVNFNQFQVLDMSLGQYISAQFELLQAIKNEWEEFLGITRQRKGQIMASDGAANSQAAIGQSTVMTSELFRKFASFEQRELQGLLDVSKTAWKNGKQGTYITSDYREGILDIGPEDIQETELGVIIKNSSKEDEKLKTLKGLAVQFAQNKQQPSTIADILDADNFAKIKEKVAEVDKAAKIHEEKISKMQGEQQQQIEQFKAEQEKGKRAFEDAKLDKELSSKEKMHREKMDVEWAKLNQTPPPEDNSVAFEQNQIKREELEMKERIENKKIAAAKNKKA